METVLRWLACAGLLMVAGCTSTDLQYLRDGIGTDIFPGADAGAAQYEDAYLGHLCQRAGFARTSADGRACEIPARAGWFTVVQAGMNDIDQRCDAYLAWLDSRRRSSTSILQQIGDTHTAVDALLVATGAGVQPLALAAAAVGLARSSFNNYTSRLLFDVDHSTVQTVVLTRQKRFREDLPVGIDNRPAAVYALRSYLRLCMPYTIETQINTTIKLYERGGLDALADAQDDPMIDARTVGSAVIGRSSEPMRPPAKPPRTISPTRFGSYEESLDPRDIRLFQRAVCVPEDGDLGPPGSSTRLAIQRALNAPSETLTDRAGVLLRRRLRTGATC